MSAPPSSIQWQRAGRLRSQPGQNGKPRRPSGIHRGVEGQVGSSTRSSPTLWVSTSCTKRRPFPAAWCDWRIRCRPSRCEPAGAQQPAEKLGGGRVDRDGAGVHRHPVHWASAGADHRLCGARGGRRPFGAHRGGVERRNRPRGLGAGQDRAQAGRGLPGGGVQPANAGDAAELDAGAGDRRSRGRPRSVGQPAHGTAAAQRRSSGRATGAVGPRPGDPPRGTRRWSRATSWWRAPRKSSPDASST